MARKEKVAHCPNCGAPINLYASTSSTVKCEYCDSFVNVADFRPSAPPSPPVCRREPSPPTKAVCAPCDTSDSAIQIEVNISNDFDTARDDWRSRPSIHPDFKPPEKLPLKTGLIVWLVFLGLVALTFLGVLEIV